MPPPDAPDEGYDGPATLHAGDTRLDVQVTLRGVFQPIDGRYHWHGRVAASAEVDATMASGTSVLLQTPTGRAEGRLSDVDPWGRYRVTGTGRPPFAVTTDEG